MVCYELEKLGAGDVEPNRRLDQGPRTAWDDVLSVLSACSWQRFAISIRSILASSGRTDIASRRKVCAFSRNALAWSIKSSALREIGTDTRLHAHRREYEAGLSGATSTLKHEFLSPYGSDRSGVSWQSRDDAQNWRGRPLLR
jgi:hypothetical protein